MEEKAKKLEMELHAEMEAIEVDRKELQYLPEDHAFLLRLCGVTCRSGSKAHTPTSAACARHTVKSTGHRAARTVASHVHRSNSKDQRRVILELRRKVR
jgi:hypothetical protein